MGWGDEIMASGCAREEAQRLGEPVTIIDGRTFGARWIEVWEGNPYIVKQDPGSRPKGPWIRNGPGYRPYLKKLSRRDGAVFTDWRARDHKGDLYLTEQETALGMRLRREIGPYVVVEPNLDKQGNPNKAWLLERWQQLILESPGINFIQFQHAGASHYLSGVHRVPTKSFRDACGYLKSSWAAVLPEGGLHHACGALGKKAVVIFGGHISPETTGYLNHFNIYSPEGSPCGQWSPCEHCRKAMEEITLDRVIGALEEVLR